MQRHNRPHRIGSGSISLHQTAGQNIERPISGVGGPKMVRGASDMGKPRQPSMSSEAGMRRAAAPLNLSRLSTPPSTPQRFNVQPLNNATENLRRVREKLATYRIAVENANEGSLEDLLPNEVVPVGVDRGESGPFAANLSPGSPTASMRAQWQFPATPQRSTRAPSERSYLTSHTQGSDITVGTHVFSAQDGVIAEEREKRKLHPVMKAKKDLFRRLGKCRFGCREKKTRCFVSHHQIEDILTLFPSAADDVRWALEHNSDRRQDDRGSPTSMQRIGSNRLAPSVEPDGRREVEIVVQRTNELFEVPAIPFDTGMDFEAETPLDDRANSYACDGISGSMVHDWTGGQGPNMPGSNPSFRQNQQQFAPGPGLINGYGSQSRSIGGTMMQATSSQNRYAGGYQASLEYTSSNLQPTGYQNTPTFGSVDGEAMLDITYSSYQEPDQEALESPIADERVLAMKHNSNNGTVCTCTIDDCFEYLNAFDHMLQHICNNHPHVQPSSPNPVRTVCVQCWQNKFHSAGTLYCQAGCQQQLETHICGQTSGLLNEVGIDLDMTGPNDFIADGSTMGQQGYFGGSDFGQQFQSFGKGQG